MVGLFLVQGVRFVYALFYARASSADLVGRVPDSGALSGVPGVVQPLTFQNELIILGACLLLPLLALIIRRWRASIPLAVLLVALGRSMALQSPDLKAPAAALVVGAALLYLALIIIRRPGFFPVMLLVGFAADQFVRVMGNTYDRTWEGSSRLALIGNLELEMSLTIALVSVLLILLSIVLWFVERRQDAIERHQEGYAPPLTGVLNLWGAIALGAIFFLEFTLLALPNAVARWSQIDYAGLVPWLLAATTLPLVPEVRNFARQFAGMFDGAWRGWLWALLLGLLLVIGRRFEGIPAAIALVVAQFLVGLTLWWVSQPGIPRRNLTGLALPFAVLTFGLLGVGDYFTYDYAYVRDMPEPLDTVDDLLRGFRDMGLALVLIAAVLLSIPIILARRRIPWRGGPTLHTLLALVLVVLISFAGATVATRDTLLRRPLDPDCMRVATYNLHGGYSQFFDPNLDRAAQIIRLSGADIVLLQEVETGRLASFGVDQVLWLARELNMEAAYFPQNERLQGLAVLSRVPIEAVDGLHLPSEGNQAAVMHVRLDPERLTADAAAGDLGPLHIYNAWLGFRVAERDGQPIPEGEQDQNRQLETLLNWIAAQHAPNWSDRILLGGTFNFGPDSPLYQRLRMAELENPAIQDPFAGLRAENAMTLYLVDGTAARYDYLWVFNVPFRGMLIDQSPEAANTSDHRPAIVAINRRDGVTCAP